MRLSPLVALEAAALVAWIGISAAVVLEGRGTDNLAPIQAEALALGSAEERWSGIFFEDQHVGYAVSRARGTKDGGQVIEERSLFRVATFGQLQEVVTAGTAVTTPDGTLSQFHFFLKSDAMEINVQGEVQGKEIVMELTQAGETQELRFPVTEAPHVGVSLQSRIRAEELSVGHSFTVPYFDPITMAEGEMEIRVEDVEIINGGEEAYWLRQRFGDVETRALVLPTGDMIRQEGALGLSMVRMTAKDAQNVPTSDKQVDLISLSAVKLDRPIANPRDIRRLEVRIEGVEATRVRHEPPLQTQQGDGVTIDVPLTLELPDLPIADRSQPQWVEATFTLPAAHPDITARAAEIVTGAATRADATKRLVNHVFNYVAKVPTIGVPNGLEVLQQARGDCNEHTALFVSLARAAGIPSRIAAGVVYSDRIAEEGAFYYHAWPEVRLGGPTDWVPVDPTFGQFPADATHIKLTEGDLDKQVEIMGVMGKLGFTLVEAR